MSLYVVVFVWADIKRQKRGGKQLSPASLSPAPTAIAREEAKKGLNQGHQ